MPKIVTLDIETFASVVFSWQERSRGPWSAIDVIEPWQPIAFGAKELGKRCKYYSLDQYKGFKPLIEERRDGVLVRKANIKPLLDDFYKIVSEADIVVGWNSKSFDMKMMRDKLISLGYPPFKEPRQIDVMLEKKKLTAGSSNRLGDTGKHWGQGSKVSHDGWDLWYSWALGEQKAQRLMRKYCIQDVNLTEKNYLHIRGWIQTHPNMANMSGNPDGCKNCNSMRIVRNGVKHTNTASYQQYICQDCGAYQKSRRLIKEAPRPKYN